MLISKQLKKKQDRQLETKTKSKQKFFLLLIKTQLTKTFLLILQKSNSKTVANLGGGDGGDASPPTSLKVTILAEKSASISNNSAPVRDASPPHQSKLNEPGRKITLNFGEDLFFFFFFWRPPNFGRKKRLNFRFRPKKYSQFW